MRTMKGPIGLMALPVMLAAAAACLAQQAPYRSGDDALDALIADIVAGRRDSAIARISSIESMSGKRTLATTPTQFVDRLIGCRPDGPAKDWGLGSVKMLKIVWACPTVRYVTVFDPSYARPYITVGNFEDEAAEKARLANPVAPPAPPLPAPSSPRSAEPQMSDADRATFLKTAFSALISGKLESVRALVAPNARITLGRRDPIAKVTVIEFDSTGPDAFVAQGRAAIAKLGKPLSLECDASSCRFRFATDDRILIAIAGVVNGKIAYIQYIYGMR